MAKTHTMICDNCNQTFLVSTRVLNMKKEYRNHFCSFSCYDTHMKSNTSTLHVFCGNCAKPITKNPFEAAKSKSGRHFCSRSCAAVYNNTHKTTGTRRSKLESHLEERLRAEFPNLELICNGKDAIGSELDFYFPQLRLAIELNGIFHYEPIYGADKLERIQANDQQKCAACLAAGIEFCTIDTSTVKRITQVVKERYWNIIKNLITPLLGRINTKSISG
jgi:very-short-patch-repair endonuclease